MELGRTAFHVVDAFEDALSEYTGAPFCVATDSCTNALYLCFMRVRQVYEDELIVLPKRTYVGVAQAARNAGLDIAFQDIAWEGEYEIHPTHIVDAARWLRRGMYQAGTMTCLSFQATKHLPIGRGGAILCDEPGDAEWFRRARLDGRDQETSIFDQTEFGFGAHCYMPPDCAARGLWLMAGLADENKPLPGMYPDLSEKEWS